MSVVCVVSQIYRSFFPFHFKTSKNLHKVHSGGPSVTFSNTPQHRRRRVRAPVKGKVFVTPPATPKTLADENTSRVPTFDRGWKNLTNP